MNANVPRDKNKEPAQSFGVAGGKTSSHNADGDGEERAGLLTEQAFHSGTIISGFYLFLFGRKILKMSFWQKVQKNRVSGTVAGTDSWPMTLIFNTYHR